MGADSLSEWPLFFFRGKAGCAKEGGAGSGVAPRDPERRTGGPQLRRKEGPWAGGRNGGAMGRKKQDTEKATKNKKVVTMPQADSGKDTKEVKKGKRKRATKNRGRSSRQKAGNQKEKKPAENLKKEQYHGAKKVLRHWVKKEVKHDAPEIAHQLVKETKDGDVRSAAIVLSLMDKKTKIRDGEGDGFDGPSLADQLMEGPTWQEVLDARQRAREEQEKTEAA